MKAVTKSSPCCPHCKQELPVESRACSVDLDRNVVHVNGMTIKLQPSQAEVLWVLARRFGEVVTVSTLLLKVWGSEGGEGNNLGVSICNLRKKLRGSGLGISTSWRKGYYLVWSDTAESSNA